MSSNPPELIHLVPDSGKLARVGTLADGRLIFQDSQFDPADKDGRRFFVTYIFDAEGRLIDDAVSLIGEADEVSDGTMAGAQAGHLAKYGAFKKADIRVRPFSISRHGLTFGLVARQVDLSDDEDGENDSPWQVDALPGLTMTFHEPWAAGGHTD